MLCLLGSDKPIVESLAPNPIDQTEAMENQFKGMSDEPFSYEQYEKSRLNLISIVNDGLNDADRQFIMGFEEGNPDWALCCAGDLSSFPSVKWKMHNIDLLKKKNPVKHREGMNKLSRHLWSMNNPNAETLAPIKEAESGALINEKPIDLSSIETMDKSLETD